MKNYLARIIAYIKAHTFLDYAFFLLLGLFSLTWFRGDFYISGGDFAWSYDFSKFLGITLYIWDETISMGVSATRQLASFFPYAFYGNIFQIVFGNSLIYEKALFFVLFSFSGISFYFLLTQIGIDRASKFIASVFYMVNPFALVVVWYISHGNIQSFYAFFPMLMGLIIKMFNSEISVGNTNLLIFFTLIGISFVNPVILALVLFTFLSYSLYLLAVGTLTRYSSGFIKQILVKSVLFICLFLLLRSNWLLPFLLNIKSEYLISGNEGGGFFSEAFNAKLNSIQLFNAFRLMGLWSFFGDYGGDLFFRWSPVFKTAFFIFMSFLIGIVVFMGFLVKTKEKYKDLFFWYFLFFTAIVLNVSFSSDLFAPLIGFIYKKLPFLEMGFRGGFLKYGFLLAMSYSVIFSLGLEHLYQSLKNKIFLLLIPIIILAFPFFSGQLFRSYNKILKSVLIRIPDDYFQLKKWDNKFKLKQRYYVLPPIRQNYNISLNWDYGYSGGDILRWFVNSPVINVYTEGILSAIVNQLDNHDFKAVNKLLSILSVKDVIFHGDADFATTQVALALEKNNLENYLATLTNKINFGRLKIYRLAENEFLPKIYIPDRLIFATGNPASIAQVVSSDNSDSTYAIYFNNQRISNNRKIISDQDTLILNQANQIVVPFFSNSYKWGEKISSDSYINYQDENIDIPKSGLYSVWLSKRSKLADYKNFEIFLPTGGVPITIDSEASQSADWISLGENDFPYGTHKIEIHRDGKKTSAAVSGDIILRQIGNITSRQQSYVEYKESNPTRYIVRIHKSRSPFLLVFNESFSNGWKAYVKKYQKSKIKNQKLEEYKILEGNEENQASKEELVDYLEKGWVSTLGRKKKIEFISKIFKGSVQNDNLSEDNIQNKFFISLNKKIYSLPTQNHFKVNTYANAWWVDINELQKQGIVKPDGEGNYDFEMILEYDGQKYVYLGIFVSLTTLVIILLIGFGKIIKKRLVG